jgi:hypothetical protein
MAGTKGRSGGWNRKPIADHILNGTFNATRHARRATQAAIAVAPRLDPPPADLVDGLTGRGLRVVTDQWALFDEWSPWELELLREAAFVINQLAELRNQPEERAAQKMLLAIWHKLDLD